LAVATALVLGVLLVHLWSAVDADVAGWITTIIVGGGAFLAGDLLGVQAAFERASTRTRWIVAASAMALAAGGAVAYLLWSTTFSWYHAGLAAIPAVLLTVSGARTNRARAEPSDMSEGPWTAP